MAASARVGWIVFVCVSSISVGPAFGQGPPVAPYDAGGASPPQASPPQTGGPPPGPAVAPPYYAPPIYGYPPAAYGYPPAAYGYPPAAGAPPMVHRARKGWVAAGAITFGVSWTLALFASQLNFGDACEQECSLRQQYLWIPIAGPLVVAGRESSSDDGSGLVLLSLIETAGVGMAVFGIVGHDVPSGPAPRLTLAPVHSPHVNGLALSALW